MATKKKLDLLELVEDIVKLNSKMRFAAIIDSKGNIREGIMKKGQTSLNSQKEEEHFCKQVAQRRTMRKEFDRPLGKVRYVHVEREKVTQFVIYTTRKTIFVTMEPELTIQRKMKIVYITGCLGFMASYLTRRCLKEGWMVYGIDKMTYAANTSLLEEFNQYQNFKFQNIDIKDVDRLYDCDYVINFAAESHVGNSIVKSDEFIDSNIVGVKNLLDLINKALSTLIIKDLLV